MSFDTATDFIEPVKVSEECFQIEKHYKNDPEIAHCREDVMLEQFLRYYSNMDMETVNKKDLISLQESARIMLESFKKTEDMKWFS
jgi:hypothetical protein